jgi:electron transfer flavoprotein alpha/beta subunit
MAEGFDFEKFLISFYVPTRKWLCTPMHLEPDLERAFSHQKVLRWSLTELRFRPEEVGLKGSATQVARLSTPAERKKGIGLKSPSHTKG